MGIFAGQAAAILGVCTKTVALYAKRGKLRAERTAGNWRIFNAEDVQRLKKKMLRARGHGE